MALSNFMGTGSYTNINAVINYSKLQNLVMVVLSTYTDNTKSSVLGTYQPRIDVTLEEFEQYFGIEALSVTDNNIYKAIYNYLKTKPEFANCIDV